MKKLSVLLVLIFILIMAPSALAASVDTQIDIGKFDCWMYSDGQTWQNVPGYGVVKPNDSPTYNYTVTYSGSNSDKITRVKSVTVFSHDETTYNKTARANDTIYDNYLESDFYNYAVKKLTVNNFKYLGEGKVQITISPTLDTYTRDPNYSDYPGQYLHEDFQGKLTQGRRYYTPTVIEWEMADAAPDFWITSPNGTSFTGEPGSTITIPTEVWNSGEKKDTTDFISWWDGESWDNKVGYYDNLTLGYSEKADTPVTVTVPATAKTLWFRCNIDNNTPAGELDLSNNALAVTVGPTGVDLALFMDASPPSIHIPHTMKSYPGKIRITAVRNGYEYETNPVNATITVNTPFGTKTFTATGLKGGDMQRFTIDCPVSTAGNYVFNGIIDPPSGLTDTDPSNNKASCTMVVTKQAAPETKDGDSDLPVGLTG